jgi:hypothetical protein
MRQTIIELELALLTPEVLLRLPQEKPPRFDVFDIHYRLLSTDLAQLTYRTSFKQINEWDKRYSLRTSMWEYQGERWQIIYHQGTPCQAF